MKDYKFIDHTADIAVELSGSTYEELFKAAFAAWKESAVEILENTPAEVKQVSLSADTYDELLVQFADELNFLFNTRKWVPLSIKNLNLSSGKEIMLKSDIIGSNFNEDKHKLKAEIKAVTYHQVDIKKINDRYQTLLVFDI